MKRIIFIGFYCLYLAVINAATTIPISNIYTWSKTALNGYKGQTITFPVPVYVTSTSSSLSVSVHPAFTGTEVALPGSTEYANQSVTNSAATFQLNGAGTHRLGEIVEDLTVYVNSTSSVTYQSGNWVANSQAQLLQGPDMSLIDQKGQHNVLVCAMNLEYYLVSGFGEGYGPDNQSQHDKQRKKVSQALALINADLYGLVEIQKGTAALQEIVDDLETNTGRTFKLISSTSSADGTYTQSAFVYCPDIVTPASPTFEVSGGPQDRRLMIAFQSVETGERFFYSINHFKAKSGTGIGDDQDKNDGQGSFNGTRVKEAQAVISTYESKRGMLKEDDILIMGDLNAYSMEDPIQLLVNNGMTNLHKYFYGHNSYSYRYHNEVGVLDHALANPTLLPQVTGMLAFHINSDEDDCHTYDGWCSDATMFRSSDHDPILVGLRLDSIQALPITDVYIETGIYSPTQEIVVHNAKKDGGKSYYAIYSVSGQLIEQAEITENEFAIRCPQGGGLYIVSVYANGQLKQFKIIVQ